MTAIRRKLSALLLTALLGLLAVTLTGCGSSEENVGFTPTGEELLREVWGMYKEHLTARRYPPRQLTDLDPYEPGAMKGYAAVRDGEVVVLWSGAGTTVLAYEKLAPEKGGAVLYRDGNILHVSGEQLQTSLPPR